YSGWDKGKKEYLDDTWAFYFAMPPDTVGYWKKIKAKDSHPPKRRHAVGAYDSARNWFIICGGFGDEGYLNDVWAFDLTEEIWINITPGPQPRIDHQAIYEPKSRRLILYGGDARLRTKFHDFWELQIHPGVSPMPEAGAKISERQ
ncbi:MAG: kelch repeat-containing protein, partial [bacterium]